MAVKFPTMEEHALSVATCLMWALLCLTIHVTKLDHPDLGIGRVVLSHKSI